MGKILLPNQKPTCVCGAAMRVLPALQVLGGVVWKCERCEKIQLRSEFDGKPMAPPETSTRVD
jgi:hypothetical protein